MCVQWLSKCDAVIILIDWVAWHVPYKGSVLVLPQWSAHISCTHCPLSCSQFLSVIMISVHSDRIWAHADLKYVHTWKWLECIRKEERTIRHWNNANQLRTEILILNKFPTSWQLVMGIEGTSQLRTSDEQAANTENGLNPLAVSAPVRYNLEIQ